MSKRLDINKAYRWAIPVLGLWLLYWIFLSWPGAMDDAFIHLRYAGNLFRTHIITYDGVHPNYGASSLLYVYLLAFFRGFTSSPALSRAVSSCVHILLFAKEHGKLTHEGWECCIATHGILRKLPGCSGQRCQQRLQLFI